MGDIMEGSVGGIYDTYGTAASDVAAWIGSPSLFSNRNDCRLDALLRLFLDTTDSVKLSRELSKIVGRPALVVWLDEMPHAFSDPSHLRAYAEEEVAARAAFLAARAKEALPHAALWKDKDWSWEPAAAFNAPNSSHLRTGAKHVGNLGRVLPSRLEGACWNRGGVVFGSDRNWSVAQCWSSLSCLGDTLLARFPKGKGIRGYLLLHEIAHLLQRQPTLDFLTTGSEAENFARNFKAEADADLFALTMMNSMARRLESQGDFDRAHDLRETVLAVKHARALNGFLYGMPHYWVAPMLDVCGGSAWHEPCVAQQPTPEACLQAGYVVRALVYARVTGIRLPSGFDAMQSLVKDWQAQTLRDDGLRAKMDNAFGGPFNWGGVNHVAQSIPALRDIIREGVITDPLTLRYATLVLDAAESFAPRAAFNAVVAQRPVSRSPLAFSAPVSIMAATTQPLACAHH